MASGNTNPFDRLPIETTQHIATHLPYDADLCKFRLISQSTHAAIDGDRCSFWRRRFLTYFEKPIWSSTKNVQYKHAYQKRRSALKNGAKFINGESTRERACLEVLRDLIVDSFSGKPFTNHSSEIADPTYESQNLTHLHRFLQANNLLQIVFAPQPRRSTKRPSTLLQTIQLLCTPMLLSLDPHIIDYHYSFPDSQLTVYSPASEQPIFGGCHGLDVNVEFVLHNVNFWKYHMVRQVEGTLFDALDELDLFERPRWWSSQPAQGVRALGKRWKGSYAYLDHEELDELLHYGHDAENDQIQDKFAGEDENFSFQDMKLELVDPNERKVPWPEAFERHLHALTPPAPTTPTNRAKTRAQKRSATPDCIIDAKPLSFHFTGSGQDTTEQFFASGWLNPLPPQHGVPGWQRMTMMKYFDNDDGSIDTEALWAYEGVVLPGGQIVLGRWWSPSAGERGEAMYSGPFVLWCVDGAKYEGMEEVGMGDEW